MKKIILFLMCTLFILTGCGSQSNAKKSLNGLLEYELAEDWQEMTGLTTITEIAVQKSDNSIGFMAEYIEYSEDTPKDFLEYQENAFKETGAVFEDEFNLEESGRKIYGKIFNASEDIKDNKFIVGIMEVEENKDAFIGFIGTLISAENPLEEITSFLKTINFTGETLKQERHIIPEKEYFEFDLPAEYRKSDRKSETNFIKTLDDGVLYASLTTLSKENLPVEEQFNSLDENFKKMFSEYEVYQEENVENLEDRDIYSKIYKYSLNGKTAYSYFNVIDFKNTNLMVNCVYDILTDSDFKDTEEELKNLTHSIHLKKNAEKLLEKDIKEFKKQIEENQKALEKEMKEYEEKAKKEEVTQESVEQTETTQETTQIEKE